jgi:hypothetical protein
MALGTNRKFCPTQHQSEECLLRGTQVLIKKVHFVFKWLVGEITLHVAKIVTTEQLQRYIPQKHGLFQVNICKFPALR